MLLPTTCSNPIVVDQGRCRRASHLVSRRAWRTETTRTVAAARPVVRTLVPQHHVDGKHAFMAIPSYGSRRSWEPSP